MKIVDYAPEYRAAFKALNQAWIEQYFKMEAADHKSLDFPEKNIIDKGGHIFMAIEEEKAIGTCALMKLENHRYEYELAKMAVVPEHQGKGIGYQLGKAIINKAKSLNAKTLYLETNAILTPAIHLYKKLGFVEVEGNISPYQRSNVQMVYEVVSME